MIQQEVPQVSAACYLGAMESFAFLFGQSGWLVAAVLFAACFCAAELGFYLARRRSKSGNTLKKDHVNAVQTTLTAVVFIILDVDRPYRGVVRVGQQSLLELKDGMSQGLPLP
jgi:hypothetical protein